MLAPVTRLGTPPGALPSRLLSSMPMPLLITLRVPSFAQHIRATLAMARAVLRQRRRQHAVLQKLRTDAFGIDILQHHPRSGAYTRSLLSST
jgi:hypothetical protein